MTAPPSTGAGQHPQQHLPSAGPAGPGHRPRSAARRWAAVAGGACALTAWGVALGGQWSGARVLTSVALHGVVLAFGAYTWRRLSRGRVGRADAAIVAQGIRRFGVPMAVFGTVWMTFQGSWPPHVGSGTELAALALLVVRTALVQVPLGLWAGYAWGRMMGSLVAPPEDP